MYDIIGTTLNKKKGFLSVKFRVLRRENYKYCFPLNRVLAKERKGI